MQLPQSSTQKNYAEQVKDLEESLKAATSDEKNEIVLKESQARLDSLAEKYQYDEAIGPARYKLYELQALIHYFEGKDDDALDFIQQAVEIRGTSYARADKLKQQVLEKTTLKAIDGSSSVLTLSETDTQVLAVREAVQRAGFWSAVSGIFLLFVVGIMASIAVTSVDTSRFPIVVSLIGLAASIYLVWSGFQLNKSDGDEETTIKLLRLNIFISVLTFWTVFPIFTLVMSCIALRHIGRLDGKYEAMMQSYEKVEKRLHGHQIKNSVFFYRSPLVVALLNIITMNIYSVYWAYKHWALIGKNTGEKLHPVFSAIFIIFTIYPLAKRIRDGATAHGYTRFKHAGWAAAGFIILALMGSSLGRAEINTTDDAWIYVVFSILLSAGVGVIMATLQRAANAHNLVVAGKKATFTSAYPGEIVVTAIGILIAALAIWGSFMVDDDLGLPQITPESSAAYERMEALRSEYDACDDNLTARQDTLDLYSEYDVNSFNSDLEKCEAIRTELNTAVDSYNAMMGFDEA